MRIACFLPHLGISGGLGVQCRLFLEAIHLVAPQIQMEVMIPRDPSALFPKSGLESFDQVVRAWGENLRLHPIDWPKSQSLADPLDPVLGSLLKSLNADLVFSSYYTGFRDPGCPQWVLYHDAGFLEFPERFGPVALARRETLKAIGKNLNGLVCISSDARERVCRGTGWPKEKTEVIWHCLTDLDPRQGRNPDAIAKRAELWPGGMSIDELGEFWFSPVGAATGFNRVRKNVPPVLAAFHKSREISGKLVIASTGVLDQTMLGDLLPNMANSGEKEFQGRINKGAWVSDDGRIVVLPNLERIAFLDTMASSRGVIYPSRYEGFGLPTIEAMALGLPLIASRATSIPEIVGDCALLVDPDQPSAFTAAMVLLEKDQKLAESLSQKGRDRATTCFTPHHCGQKWHQLFEKTLKS